MTTLTADLVRALDNHPDQLVREIWYAVTDHDDDLNDTAERVYGAYFGTEDEPRESRFAEIPAGQAAQRELRLTATQFASQCVDWANYAQAYGDTSDPPWLRDDDSEIIAIADIEDVDVPAWIDRDVTLATVRAIAQGGCDSGAYMPAVTYHQALATMGKYGDEVLDYSETETRADPSLSWAGIACFYLSEAVELWAHHTLSALGLDD